MKTLKPFFEIVHQSTKSKARVGKLHTSHGIIDTPAFVPVGTNAVLKHLTPDMAKSANVQCMFSNTYHLVVYPGAETIKQAGGIHKYSGFDKPFFTDSGGFQIFSLSQTQAANELKGKTFNKNNSTNLVSKITEMGASISSYRNGDTIILTPESSIKYQKQIGADIILPLDELPPFHVSEKKLYQSFFRTHRWQERSLKEHKRNINGQKIYSIIHGGIDKQLRTESVKFLDRLDFDGTCIGGSLGETKEQMYELIEFLSDILPPKPTHLLGIGDMVSVNKIVPFGIDTFDSSFPTKCSRHGTVFNGITKEKTSIRSLSQKNNLKPLVDGCECYTYFNVNTESRKQYSLP